MKAFSSWQTSTCISFYKSDSRLTEMGHVHRCIDLIKCLSWLHYIVQENFILFMEGNDPMRRLKNEV